MIAQWGDGFQRHVAGPLDRPFVVQFQKGRAQEAEDGCFIGKDSHHIRSPLDLAIEALIGGSLDVFVSATQLDRANRR